MGNKLNKRSKSESKDRNTDSVNIRKKKKSSSANGKSGGDPKRGYRSCPEFPGAVPYKFEDEKKVDITLYRSYSDMEKSDQSSMRSSRPDVTVYRRSTNSIHAGSLPYNLEKKGRRAQSGGSLDRKQVKSTSALERRSTGGDVEDGVVFSPSEDTIAEAFVKPISPRRARQVIFEYPPVQDVADKLIFFEKHFVEDFGRKFRQLEDSSILGRLQILSLATVRQGQGVSLGKFLEDKDGVMSDLEAAVVVIPRALYSMLESLRKNGAGVAQLWRPVADAIADGIAVEAANELSRIYEYQIAMLLDKATIGHLASHSVDCVFEYIKHKNVYIDRNSVIWGVINTRPPRTEETTMTVSVVLGEKEQKWDLFDILKKPGLRKQLDNGEQRGGSLYQFFAALSLCDSNRYGYRSESLEYDNTSGLYKFNFEEDKLYAEEQCLRYDNFHQQYIPYKRLFGVREMEKYCKAHYKIDDKVVSLTEFVLNEFPARNKERGIYVVYRPCSEMADDLNMKNGMFENSDLSRIDLQQVNLKSANFKDCVLVGANLDGASLDYAQLEGTDFSYGNLCRAKVSIHNFEGIKATYVALDGCEPLCKKPEPLEDYMPSSVISHSDGLITNDESGITHAAKELNLLQQKMQEERRLEREKAEAEAEAAQMLRIQKEKLIKDKQAAHKKKQAAKSSRRSSGCSSSGNSSTDHNILEAPPKPARVFLKTHTFLNDSVDGRDSEELLGSSLNNSFVYSETDGDSGIISGLPPGEQVSPIYSRPDSSTTQAGHAKYTNCRIPDAISEEAIQEIETAQQARPMTSSPIQAESAFLSQSAGPVDTSVELRKSGKEGQAERTPVRYIHQAMKRKAEFPEEILEAKASRLSKLEGNLPSNLPSFSGRHNELDRIAASLMSSTHMVTILGSMGIGRSTLAIAIGNHIHQTSGYAVFVVDAAGCFTLYALFGRLVNIFRLKFVVSELHYFCNILKSHKQKILLIFLNVEIPDISDLSAHFDSMLDSVTDLKIICTSSSHFYDGQLNHEAFQISPLDDASDELLKQLSPTVTNEDAQKLAELADDMPLALYLYAKFLNFLHGDIKRLHFQFSLIERNTRSSIEDLAKRLARGSEEEIAMLHVIQSIILVIENLPPSSRKLLSSLSILECPFDIQTGAAVAGVPDFEADEDFCLAFKELQMAGLVGRHRLNGRYHSHQLVQHVAQEYLFNRPAMEHRYCSYYVERLQTLCQQFHSKECYTAMESAREVLDNIEYVLNMLPNNGSLFDLCKCMATQEMAIFLHFVIVSEVYVQFYKDLIKAAKLRNEHLLHSLACCSLAYHHNQKKEYAQALPYATKAREIQKLVKEKVIVTSKSFSLQVFGKAYWYTKELDEKDKGMEYVKKSLDLLKSSMGLRKPLTTYAYEEYAGMQIQKDNVHKARHYYNISDFFIQEKLGEHPILLDGYDKRRVVWDKLGLYVRATETARTAAFIAEKTYGDHPITALMLSNWCECIVKRGNLQDAIECSWSCLLVKQRLLGDHIETAAAHKTFSYLMLKGGFYKKATAHAQKALDIYNELKVEDAYKKDINTLISLAKSRMQAESTVYVKLETQRSSRPGSGDSSFAANGSVLTPAATDV